MVVSCAAFGCTNRAKKGSSVSFHNFPKDPVLLKKWIISLKRKNFHPTKFSKLCSQHFKIEDFLYNFGKKTIKSNAVPSIFNLRPLKKKQRQKGSKKTLNEEIISKHVIPEIEDYQQPGTSSQSELPVVPVTTFTNFRINERSKHVIPEMEDYQQPGTSSQSELPELPVVPVTTLTNFRINERKRQPVYFGDFNCDDIEDPKKFKLMWSVAAKTISKQKKTVMYLRTKILRLQKKVKTLNDLVVHLQNSTKISSDCQLLLKENIPASQKQLLLRQLNLSTMQSTYSDKL